MRAHVFVDCENISIEVFKKAYTELKRKYEITKCDLYGKESCIPKFYDKLDKMPESFCIYIEEDKNEI